VTTLSPRHSLRLLAVVAAAGCTAQPALPKVTGDWDAYFANGVTARPGFEGWRRMGFAHFSATSAGVTGAIRRRTGETMVEVTRAEDSGDSLTLGGDAGQSIAKT